jgi:hypothetical protein
VITLVSMELSGSSRVVHDLSSGNARAWTTWLVYEAALLHLAAPLMVAVPLARERELGTMGLLLATPRHASGLFLKPLRGLLGFLVAGTALYQVHHTVAVRLCEGLHPELQTAGLEVALASLWPAALALLLSSVASTVWGSVSLAAMVIALVELGPLVGAAAAYLLGFQEQGTRLLLLVPMSVIGGEGSQLPHGAVVFAAAGIAVAILGSATFERVQRRFQVLR